MKRSSQDSHGTTDAVTPPRTLHSTGPSTPGRPPDTSRRESLERAIDHAAHLLPAQGPITVFIHHNTLHAFEARTFTDAVQEGASVFGCQPYLSEERYRKEWEQGRIHSIDIETVLREDLGDRADEPIGTLCTRFALRLAMLQFTVRHGPAEELLWHVAETDALHRMRRDASTVIRRRLVAKTRRWALRDLRSTIDRKSRSNQASALSELPARFGPGRMETWGSSVWEAFGLQALWLICRDGCAALPAAVSFEQRPIRHRDYLMRATGIDIDSLVHEVLIPFCGAFLDQGLAHWHLPNRDEGFFPAFCALYRCQRAFFHPWRRGLRSEIKRLQAANTGPHESILESLDALGVAESEWNSFLSATLLALRGWAGMIHFLEERGDRAVYPIPSDSLVGFLAARLLLEKMALTHIAPQAIGFQGPLRELRAALDTHIALPVVRSAEQRAFAVFEIAQVLGWTPEELSKLAVERWAELVSEIEAFSEIERRRLLHQAYERRFYVQALDAVASHNRTKRTASLPARFQALFCIDEREESIRRHMEEVVPEAETFGIAGFYFLPMYYRAATDAHFIPLCPPVIRPRYWVREDIVSQQEADGGRRERTRRFLGYASHLIHGGSRALALGALLSGVAGAFASLPLVARTFFPRFIGQLRSRIGGAVLDPGMTRVQLERTEAEPGSTNGHLGFSVGEMTDIAERVLRDTGLTDGFARLVLTFGHGSTSMNNPHESAHDCGACGGARGGASGRVIATILNDGRIRDRLRSQGIVIPPDTRFIGGMHNTCNEAVTFYDLDLLPESHRAEFEDVRALIEEAADRDAHERCRRFSSASLGFSFAAARRHVEARAEDLSQVRPEWGHATNAICVVGRRSRTKGLFLDRRAFLNSYDPTQDDDGTILARILQAAMPVCAGISLEYYFSYVDNPGYGSGTKLPHNIASLVGVMDGAASDLRTGLPWQMVEIHEPVRILFVIEVAPEKLLGIMDRDSTIAQFVRHEWVRIATLDPDSAEIHEFRNGEFRLYHPQTERLPWAPTSVDWYRGWRDHLDFATIGP